MPIARVAFLTMGRQSLITDSCSSSLRIQSNMDWCPWSCWKRRLIKLYRCKLIRQCWVTFVWQNNPKVAALFNCEEELYGHTVCCQACDANLENFKCYDLKRNWSKEWTLHSCTWCILVHVCWETGGATRRRVCVQLHNKNVSGPIWMNYYYVRSNENGFVNAKDFKKIGDNPAPVVNVFFLCTTPLKFRLRSTFWCCRIHRPHDSQIHIHSIYMYTIKS